MVTWVNMISVQAEIMMELCFNVLLGVKYHI